MRKLINMLRNGVVLSKDLFKIEDKSLGGERDMFNQLGKFLRCNLYLKLWMVMVI
jgi:hypothetical protein